MIYIYINLQRSLDLLYQDIYVDTLSKMRLILNINTLLNELRLTKFRGIESSPLIEDLEIFLSYSHMHTDYILHRI